MSYGQSVSGQAPCCATLLMPSRICAPLSWLTVALDYPLVVVDEQARGGEVGPEALFHAIELDSNTQLNE